MTRTVTPHRSRIVVLLLAVLMALTACGSSDSEPEIKVAVGDQSATLKPTLYCVDGDAQLAEENAALTAMQVKPDAPIVINVPSVVADAGWTIQIWSVNDTADGAVPLEQIGNIDAGNERSYEGFTTSDAVPDRFFIIVAIPEDPDCQALGSAGIWTMLLSRVA